MHLILISAMLVGLGQSAVTKLPLMSDVQLNNGQATCTSPDGISQPLDPLFVQKNFNIVPNTGADLTYAGSCQRPAGDYWANAVPVTIDQTGWSTLYAAAGWVNPPNLHLCWRTWQVSTDNKNWTACTPVKW
ncbi:hypothetical protein PYCC9005_001674 [Savitreella phatthalungensis]